MDQIKETALNTIQKATIKNDRCVVSFKENYREANYTNKVDKECDQIVHSDLKRAYAALIPFLITIAEQPEAKLFDSGNIDIEPDEEIEEAIAAYTVTGYVHGGSDESAGVSIIGQKALKTGQVLNLIAPFTKFENEDYSYGTELLQAIEQCDYEVKEYVFNGKFGIIQHQLDFDTDAPAEADIQTADVPKKPRGRKKKEAVAAFDTYA